MEQVLAALMAIGNLVHMSPTVLSTLNKLIVDSELPIVTRLAAIDAFRSSPCNEEVTHGIFHDGHCFLNHFFEPVFRHKIHYQPY